MKNSPAATAQTAQIFDRFLALTQDGVYRYTFTEGRILYANAGFVRILDLDCAPEAVPGKRLEDLMIYTEAPGTVRKQADAKDNIRNFEYHFKTLKGADRWVRHDSCVITDPETGEKAVEAFVRDITESKRAEMELRALNERLSAANKELESFCYSVAHDLRSPLRAIDGFSQAFLDEYAAVLDAQGREYLGRVREGVQRMAQMIDDLLELARVGYTSTVSQAVDLSAWARDAAEELRRFQPSREAEFVLAPGLAAAGDPVLLRSVMRNLLDNAWKFTAKKPRARIEFGAAEVDGKRAFFVRDDGAGFDMAYASKLFGAFQRLHTVAEFPGNGIGLAIAKRIIHRHGGRMWAEGAVGQGATFYFTLPEGKVQGGG